MKKTFILALLIVALSGCALKGLFIYPILSIRVLRRQLRVM